MTAPRKKGFTLIELMIVVAIIGILAAIAIPNFIKFQAKSKQSEPKANLRGLWVAEKSYFADRDTFSTKVSDVGFIPERGNRYAIANGGPAGNWSDRSSATETFTGLEEGYTADTFKGFAASTSLAIVNITATAYTSSAGTCSPTANVGCVTPGNTGAFMALAAANIDNDASIDTWCVSNMSVVISSNATVGSEAEPQSNGAGIPSNNVNDIR